MKAVCIMLALMWSSLCVYAADALEIPDNVVMLHAFLQKPDTFEPGSSEKLAEAEDKKTFSANLQRYVAIARQRQMKLIVTAQATNGEWVQNQIRYKGKFLQTGAYFHPDPSIYRRVTGAELPVD